VGRIGLGWVFSVPNWLVNFSLTFKPIARLVNVMMRLESA
jgi:hypothetical protein